MVQAAQLVLDIVAGLLAQAQQVTGIDVQFARQDVNADFFSLLQAYFPFGPTASHRYRGSPVDP
jgi:hypothetical protein